MRSCSRSSNSPILAWKVLTACMKNNPSVIETDACCQTKLLSTIFSENQLRQFPQIWFQECVSDMCWIHCHIDPPTKETSRILQTTFVKLNGQYAIEAELEIIRDNIASFYPLERAFWGCTYFGNSRISWLVRATNMSNEQATEEFGCVIASVKWDTVVDADFRAFQGLCFNSNLENSVPIMRALVNQTKLLIDTEHLACLLQQQNEFLLQKLPYIYHLICNTPMEFRQSFDRAHIMSLWRLPTLYALRNIIRSRVTTRAISENQFVYAVSAFYFLWNRGDQVTFDGEAGDIPGSEIETYIERFSSPRNCSIYDGRNLLAAIRNF